MITLAFLALAACCAFAALPLMIGRATAWLYERLARRP